MSEKEEKRNCCLSLHQLDTLNALFNLGFAPLVPEGLNNPKLTNLKYRNMILNISVEGEGTNIKSFIVNGIESDQAFISKDVSGVQNVAIVLIKKWNNKSRQ